MVFSKKRKGRKELNHLLWFYQPQVDMFTFCTILSDSLRQMLDVFNSDIFALHFTAKPNEVQRHQC